ncbi:MAG: Hsp70 family protein [Deltaproteobacteria bacterium]|nr:Hsp70 family protein [Deltaproteobacteria bacterium]
MSNAKYIVGIDLGTTNSILAYTAADADAREIPKIQVLEIPQLVGPGAVAAQEMLPSFIYLPGESDIALDTLKLPWHDDVQQVVGVLARNRGAELPQQLISSSKSWLCHTMVDRNQPILPWGSPAEVRNLSPVEASAAILDHIRWAWNYTIAPDDENLVLERQEIYLTVPASFDAVARELTVKAAAMAGLPDIILLEEPQAAFYAWIQASGDRWRDAVRPGDLVLVCDLGGGTSDFSLIRVSESSGSLELERIAVGNHILIGGDNMDLALAYAVAKQMTATGKKLDSWQMRALWHTCRSAKEKILESSDSEAIPISVLGRGSGLIGGTLGSELTRDIVEQVIVEGFFPFCEPESRPATVPRAGIRETGLAYEADPAVTRHLAQFLCRNEDRPRDLPTAVLFNGGVMKARLLQERVTEVLTSWQTDSQLRVLESSNLDLAVATGAAYYGLARGGRGVRIRSGLNKSYYIGVAASLPAVPGMPTPIKALCVAPFGMEEGSTTEPSEREFNLIVGEPAKFDLLGSAVRTGDEVGMLIEDWEEEIEPITTIETTLDGNYGTVLPVSIQIQLTEIGTLELWCVSRQDGSRWKLEFSVREKT